MNVNGISGHNAGVQAFQMNMNQGTDAVSKNLQKQIANAQKQMQELGQNKEMSPEDKMKKRQEIQQQMSELQNQLRQHQMEQRKEYQQKGSSMDDMPGGNGQEAHSKAGTKGMSTASMQAMIAADVSMNKVKAQGSVKTQMDGRAGVLKAEIKQDAGRSDVEKKKEELAVVEAKAKNIEASQMNVLSEIHQILKEAEKEEQSEEKTEDMETPENHWLDGEEKSQMETVGNNVDVTL